MKNTQTDTKAKTPFVKDNKLSLGKAHNVYHKFSEKFMQAFHDDFEKHGQVVLNRCRNENPAAYLRIAASLIPKQHIFSAQQDDGALDNIIENYTDEQLDQLITGLCEVGIASKAAKEKTKAKVGIKPAGIH